MVNQWASKGKIHETLEPNIFKLSLGKCKEKPGTSVSNEGVS